MKRAPVPDTASFFLRNISKHLKAHFKALCARENKTMKRALIDYMRHAVKEGKL